MAFERAFDWLGFGAKTAVGYGALRVDDNAKQARAERRKQRAEALAVRQHAAERQAALAALDPVDRVIALFLDARPDKAQPELSALIGATKRGEFDQVGRAEVAKRIRDRMQTGKRWREKSQAKKPEKDRDLQDTLLVKSWLAGN